MTDEQTTTSTPPSADEALWRVEGGGPDANGRGLDDTVVRIDPIPANGPAYPLPSAPPQPIPADVVPDPQAAEFVAVDSAIPDYVAPDPVAAAASLPVAAAAPLPASEVASKRKKAIRRTRKARLRIARLDPWSVMKTTFMFSIAFGIMSWVAVYLLWMVVERSGLFGAVNEFVANLISNPNDTTPWRIEDYVSTNRVLGATALLAVINVVIITALGTIFAFLYNLSANVLGGLEVTLAED